MSAPLRAPLPPPAIVAALAFDQAAALLARLAHLAAALPVEVYVAAAMGPAVLAR